MANDPNVAASVATIKRFFISHQPFNTESSKSNLLDQPLKATQRLEKAIIGGVERHVDLIGLWIAIPAWLVAYARYETTLEAVPPATDHTSTIIAMWEKLNFRLFRKFFMTARR